MMGARREITYTWLAREHVVNWTREYNDEPPADIVRRKVIESFGSQIVDPAEYLSLPPNWIRRDVDYVVE
jgi:hypothetical protein